MNGKQPAHNITTTKNNNNNNKRTISKRVQIENIVRCTFSSLRLFYLRYLNRKYIERDNESVDWMQEHWYEWRNERNEWQKNRTLLKSMNSKTNRIPVHFSIYKNAIFWSNNGIKSSLILSVFLFLSFHPIQFSSFKQLKQRFFMFSSAHSPIKMHFCNTWEWVRVPAPNEIM